jgi:sarcosine oxidase
VDGPQFIYGFPNLPGQGLKVASHNEREPVAGPDFVDRKVHPADWAEVSAFIKTSLPGVSPTPIASSVCLYTMTPDEHFIVDFHPEYPQVSFACGFSGHGFKFASIMGEILADFAERGDTPHPIDFLRLRRLVPT